MIGWIGLFLLVVGSEAEGVRISGSSTAAPVIADTVSGLGFDDFDIVPTGTVRGFEELCMEGSVPMIGASRRISPAELETCSEYGINELYEVNLGLDGIILAQGGRGGPYAVELRELFLAAATMIPGDETCVLVPNPNESWNEINKDLPNRKVRIYGPPASSGTRDVFVERALAEGARQVDCLAELERRDPAAFERAIMPRHDEVWLDAGENDEAIAIALRHVNNAIGIFGWRSYDQRLGLRALQLDGVVPNEETIASGAYPLSRPLFLYASPEALRDPDARQLITTFSAATSDGNIRRYTTGTGAITEVGETDLAPGKRVYRSPR